MEASNTFGAPQEHLVGSFRLSSYPAPLCQQVSQQSASAYLSRPHAQTLGPLMWKT